LSLFIKISQLTFLQLLLVSSFTSTSIVWLQTFASSEKRKVSELTDHHHLGGFCYPRTSRFPTNFPRETITVKQDFSGGDRHR
jgi:hypothetical protein